MASSERPPAGPVDPRLQHLSRSELRARLEGERRVLSAAAVLASALDLADLMKAIVHESRHVLRCDRARLSVHERPLGGLPTGVAVDPETAGTGSGLERAVAQYVVRRRDLVNLADPTRDDRFAASVESPTDCASCRILAAPLVVPRDPTPLAALQLRRCGGGPFDQLERELFGSYCQHAAVALDRVRRIEMLSRERSMRASLEVARGIQRGFMPSRLPPITGYEAATWWMANEAVGGDYCDVIPLKDLRVALTIADVSGHGLGPSLIMAEVRAALHALVLEHTEPEVLLNLLGRSLSQDLSSERFITMALGVLDPVDHSVQYANAGHAPALHFEVATGDFVPLESTGTPLGVVDCPSYHQGWPFTVDVGDLMVFCTDGIVEALDDRDQRFGQTRLEGIIRAALSLPVTQIVARVGAAVQDHYGGGSPPDDLTILTVRRND